MSHGWAYEGDDKQSAAPSAAPTPAPLPIDKDAVVAAAVEEEDAVSSMVLLHDDDPIKEATATGTGLLLIQMFDSSASMPFHYRYTLLSIHSLASSLPAALPADADKAPAVNSMPLLQECSTPSFTVREHGWMRAQYSDDEERIKDQQHRVLPPMSHGWANEGPGGGIVPSIGFKDEVGQARAREDIVREAPAHGDKVVAAMPPAAKDQP